MLVLYPGRTKRFVYDMLLCGYNPIRMSTGNQPASKRTYTRLDFTLEQEEELIDYVKVNPALFNPTMDLYKNKMYRDRLWEELGSKLGKTGNLQ